MIARVAIPSRGRLRDFALELLKQAGFTTSLFDGHGSRAIGNELEFIEMRPRDAAAWLGTGRINGAFISTDLVLEEDLGHLASLPLGKVYFKEEDVPTLDEVIFDEGCYKAHRVD